MSSTPHKRTSSRALHSVDPNTLSDSTTTANSTSLAAQNSAISSEIMSDRSSGEDNSEREKLRMGGWTFPTSPAFQSTPDPFDDADKGPPLIGMPEQHVQRSGGTLSSKIRSPPPPMLRLPHVFPASPNPSLHAPPEEYIADTKAKHQLSQAERDDYRRRRNNDSTSLAFVGTTRRSPSSSPLSFLSHHSTRLLRVLERKSVLESFMAIAFVGSMIMFFCALSGVGYVDQGGRTWPAVKEMKVEEGIKVEIPPNYRIKILSDSNPPRPTALVSHTTSSKADDIPADVHHPAGDSTHETTVEMMSDSPDDPSLDDAHVHHSHGGKRPLFGDREDGEIDSSENEEEGEEEVVLLRGHRGHAHRLAGEEEEEGSTKELDHEHDDEETADEETANEEDDFKPHYPDHTTPDEPHHIVSEEEKAGNVHRRPELEKLLAERESIGLERARWEGNVRDSRRMV